MRCARAADRTLLGAFFLLTCGVSCGGDDQRGDDSSTGQSTVASTEPSTTAASTVAETTTGDGPGDDATTSSSTSTTSASSAGTSTTSRPTSGSPTEPCPPVGDETGSNALTGNMGFSFADTPYCDYEQIDRVGIPLVITLLITSKEAYRAATPADDNALTFVISDIFPSLSALHDTLGTALENEGWTRCTVIPCQTQTTDLVIPDLLYMANEGAPGFRTGRRLDAPMADLVLAQLLLDLDEHDLDAFAAQPLNPPENDVAFSDEWPYLAEPH
jgi:hypothetical protein